MTSGTAGTPSGAAAAAGATAATGRTAIVTGGSRGIGRAIVQRLAADGVRVVLGYASDAAAADEVVAAVRAGGGWAHAVRADLETVAGVHALFDAALAELGAVDVLVNNAGVIAPSPVAQMSEADYERTFAVNTRAVFFAMQRAAQVMADGGRIVNVSSVNTAFSPPTTAAYSASKAAVEQFARVAAKELGGRGITVNTVSPGATDTDMFATNPPERRQQAAQMSPFGRLGTPEDIADVVAFLASDQARWITGQTVAVNGGIA